MVTKGKLVANKRAVLYEHDSQFICCPPSPMAAQQTAKAAAYHIIDRKLHSLNAALQFASLVLKPSGTSKSKL